MVYKHPIGPLGNGSALRIGSRVALVARFLGTTLTYTYEIVQFDSRQVTMRTAQGPFPMETTYTWEPVGAAKTRMTLRNRGKPTGFSRGVAPFMAIAVRRANRKDVAPLKRRLEERRGE